MNEGLNQPQKQQNPRNRKSRRRRRNFGSQNPGQNSQNSQNSQNGSSNQGRPGGQNRQNRNNRGGGGQRRGGPGFVGPMDHSYRNQGNGNSMQGERFHNGAQASPNMEPLTQRVDAHTT